MNLQASQSHAVSHLAAALEGHTSTAFEGPSRIQRSSARPTSAQVHRHHSNVSGGVAQALPSSQGSGWSPGDTVGMLINSLHPASTTAGDSRRAATAALIAEQQEQNSRSRMWHRMKTTGIIQPSLPQAEHSTSAILQGSTSHLVSHARAAALLSLLTADAQPAGVTPGSIASHDLQLTATEPALAAVEAEAAAERDMGRLTCVVQANRSASVDEGDVCCVCLEPLQSGGRLRALRCSHVMHEACCRGVMRAHARMCRQGQNAAPVLRCPLCRLPAEDANS
jgi:hypothetical protein